MYMVLDIEDDVLKNINLTHDQAILDFAIGIYIDNKITLGQGAHIAFLSQTQFLKELGKCRIPIHYDKEEFDKDFATHDTP